MTLRGNTRDFPLAAVVRMLGETKKTGELQVRSGEREAALGLADGRVVTAIFADETPVTALGEIFAFEDALFEFTPWEEAPVANLSGELDDLLRQAHEHKVWLIGVRELIPHDRLRFRLSASAADGGAVTFSSERWRALLAANGERDVPAIAQMLGLDHRATLDLLSGLIREGAIETVEARPEPEPEPPHVPTPEWPGAARIPTSEWPAPAPVTMPEAPAAAQIPTPEAPAPAPVRMPEAPAAARMPTHEAPAAAQMPTHEAPAAAPDWISPASVPDWASASAMPEAMPTPPIVDTPVPPADWGPAMPKAEPVIPAPPTSDLRADLAAALDERLGTLAPPPEPPAPVRPRTPEPPRIPAAPPLDDRLAALQGVFGPPTQTPPLPDPWVRPAPVTEEWKTPVPSIDNWTRAAPGASPPLGAEPAPQSPPPPTPLARSASTAAEEWAEQPTVPAEKRKGLFGRFRKDESAAAAGEGPAAPALGSSRAGRLAALSNALVGEYNSGTYGKGRVGDRIANLLMRVDELADPIDRPLPVVDDRIDVQALEREGVPEPQVVPYLAALVSTIYGDAEKAFGRDKAKRGYRAALQLVFGGDTAVLAAPDLAGKLPKV